VRVARGALAGSCAVLLIAGTIGVWAKVREPAIVVGVPHGAQSPVDGPTVIAAAPPTTASPDAPGDAAPGRARPRTATVGRRRPRPEPGPAPGLALPDGVPWRPPLKFSTTQPLPRHLVFILVIGSDARRGEALDRARADSLHLLAINPATHQGTILGLPRDSWVEIPGHGRGKLNSAHALGGPDLLSQTVRDLTGLPVHYYVLTGFTGLERLVDELGGVDVFVERRMNDRSSGARLEPGWHRFSGGEALAFSRNRHDVALGDFSRSENQGRVILAALAKMRAEVADDDGIARWTRFLLQHAALDMPMSELPVLGALARRIDPARITNVVAPGSVGTAGRQSVVFLSEEAVALFGDLRDDAVVGTASPEPAPSTTTTSSTPPPTTSTSLIGP